MPPVAWFHLGRYPTRHAAGAMAQLVAGRRSLDATPGLRFARRLGTGRGSAMGLGADLRRWATFAVWDDEEALDAFLATSQVGAGGDHDQPVAVLTRARIPVRHWPAFYRAVPAVDDHLRRSPGLLAAVGIGEAPVGLQATFSLWRSTPDMEAFAYRGSPHEDVVRRTRRHGWFREELFARFRPYRSTGTWDGVDPLAGAGRGRAGGNGS
jgi:hypothetical protein